MNVITLDIETIPTEDPVVVARLAEKVKAPATYKKPESIAEWEATQKPAAVEEARLKTSFDGAYGRIVCIGMKIDDQPTVIFSGDEKELLAEFHNDIHQVLKERQTFMPVIVGHNILSFDLRFIKQRSIINGVASSYLMPYDASKYKSERVYDTMLQFAGHDGRISLDNLALALGLEGKNGITGADVYPMYKEGRLQEICEYCAGDVDLTYQVYQKMNIKPLGA